MRLDFLFRALALLEELEQNLKVFHGRFRRFELLHPGFFAAHAAHHLLRFLGVVPELGVLGQLLILLDVDALLPDGEVSTQGVDALPCGLDLVGIQHVRAKLVGLGRLRRPDGAIDGETLRAKAAMAFSRGRPPQSPPPLGSARARRPPPLHHPEPTGDF